MKEAAEKAAIEAAIQEEKDQWCSYLDQVIRVKRHKSFNWFDEETKERVMQETYDLIQAGFVKPVKIEGQPTYKLMPTGYRSEVADRFFRYRFVLPG